MSSEGGNVKIAEVSQVAACCLVGLACLGLAWWLLRSGEILSPVAATVGSGLDGGKSDGVQEPRVLESGEPEWLEHLRHGREIRLLVDQSEVAVSQSLGNVGLLPAEKAQVRQAIVSRVEAFERRMNMHYDKQGWSSIEVQRLEEIKAMALLKRYKAYGEAFERGDYFLIPDGAPEPSIGEGCVALNLGVTCVGRPCRVVIVIDKSAEGIEAIGDEQAKRQAAYVALVAYRFNELPDAVRAEMARRFRSNRPEDASWIKKNFPAGVVLDAATNTMRPK